MLGSRYKTRYLILGLILFFIHAMNIMVDQREALEKTIVELEQKEIRYRDRLMDIASRVYLKESSSVGGRPTLEAEGLDELYAAILSGITDYDSAILCFDNYFDSRDGRIDSVPSVWPLKLGEVVNVTSGFGWRLSPFSGKTQYHPAIDVTGIPRAKVLSTLDGVVEEVWPAPGWSGGIKYRGHPDFGGYVIIRHEGGFVTHYGHLSKVFVVTGQPVKRGMAIGIIGNTGASTGIHLHYEIRLDGEPVNPMKYLRLF